MLPIAAHVYSIRIEGIGVAREGGHTDVTNLLLLGETVTIYVSSST